MAGPIKIRSLEDAEKYINILFEKNGFTNQNIVDEITHLRSELSEKIGEVSEKIDGNTLAVKVLEQKFVTLNDTVTEVKQEQRQTNRELKEVQTELKEVQTELKEAIKEQRQTNRELVEVKAEQIQTNRELAEIKEILKSK